MIQPFRKDLYTEKMCFSFASLITIGLFFMSTTVGSTGELFMIRSPKKTNDTSMKLTCMTEDADGALFWVENQSKILSSEDCALTYDVKNVKNCSYDSSGNSTVKSIAWLHPNNVRKHWNVENITKNPFEDKRNSQLLGKGWYQAKGKLKDWRTSGSLVLFRPDWEATNLELIKCPQFAVNGSNPLYCSATNMSKNNSLSEFVNPYYWYAYTLFWNASIVDLTGYYTTHINKTYIPSKSNSPAMTVVFDNGNSTAIYGYRYLHTMKETFPLEFSVSLSRNYICLDLIVRLCRECQLDIDISTNASGTSNEYKRVKKILSKPRSDRKNDPDWQFEVIDERFETNNVSDVTIKITTVKNESCSNKCFWSFYCLRECTPSIPSIQNSRKISALTDGQSNLACQKVSHQENIMVASNASITNISSSTLKIRLRRNRSLCDYECGASCKGTSICYSTDAHSTRCICATGFQGENCDQECPPGRFGYNCVEECSRCKQKRCSKTNGNCTLGCIEKNYSPPFCEKKLKKADMAKTEQFQPPKVIWLTVPLVLLFVLSMGYMLNCVRNLNQNQSEEFSLSENVHHDSGAYPEKFVAFENSVRKDAENGLLERQFELLPKGLVRPCEYGRLPENEYKNRYGNLIAYDDTRVMLVKNPSDPYSDYINANYVQGYQRKNAYIATQGPLPETVADFWRMVWQEEVRVICMLVDTVEGRKVMCEVYWPEVGREVEYGNFVISNVAERKLADYICRTFVVSTRSGMERRQVDHLQYKGWTDQDIPMYSHSLLEYLKRLQSIAPGPGPIVVHCSAGVGRTGCIILCDICLHRIIIEGTVNVHAEAKSIYSARANMLRDYLQYTLAHVVPIEFRRTLPTMVPCRDLSPHKIQELKDELPVHMNWLKRSAWMNEALRPLQPLRPTHPENVLKNRFQRFMPAGPYLVKLPRYPEYDTTSDYISAVSVDGVKMKKQYLASQLPMPSTLTDFWRLIVHENVELIVILHNADPDDDTCCAVIPKEKTLIPYPYVKVETKEILKTNEYFTSSALLLTDSTEVPTTTRKIIAFTCNNWRHDLVTSPPPREALINLWSASEKMKRTSAPTLVLCYDGFTACGLYIAMSFVLQKISLDQECDVISAVQAIRRSRSEFVQFQWEFEYLYDAVMKYMDLRKG